MATIVLTGGGTAGHCTPHLAILPYLRNHFNKVYYIGSESGIERQIIERAGIEYFFVPCAKLTRNSIKKNITTPIKVLSGIRKAKKLLKRLKPDVVFSKGGYVSVPIVFAAHKLKIPIISHESDFSVGLANKLTSKYCKLVLTSFSNTAETLKNGLFVGSPIRNNIKIKTNTNNYQRFNLSNDKPVLLVTGGSQGAAAINAALKNALEELLDNYNVIHICGKGNLDTELSHKGYYQAEFLSDIEKAFSIADVCVSRAGSNTVFELISLKIPTVLIPLPKGTSRGDQIQNAEYFQKLGLATVLYQENLTKSSLILAINNCFQNKNEFLRNFNAHPISDQSEKIAQIIIKNSKN